MQTFEPYFINAFINRIPNKFKNVLNENKCIQDYQSEAAGELYK